MKKFYYTLKFSPYLNIIRAKNKKDAFKKIRKIWSEYNLKEILTILNFR